MQIWAVTAPAHPVRAVFAVIAGVAISLVAVTSVEAQPQQIQPKQQQPKEQQPKQQPKAQPKQPAQAPQAAPQTQAQPQQQQPQQLPIIYSPWTKFCGKDQNNPNAKEVCLTVKEARLETGQFVAGAALIEQEGEQKKILRVTLPLGMQLIHGTRMIVDQHEPMIGRYVVCLPNGCMADFEVNADFVQLLKKGQKIELQGINLPGHMASYPLPLADFAKANEGPPTDPKVFEEQQRKLQEELQRKAEEARRRLQERGGQPGAAAPPPTQAR